MRRINPLVAALLAVASAPAAATFHFTAIREVYVGPLADPNAQYVQLQMYSAGQSHMDGHAVTFYGPTGTLLGSATFADDVPNGVNQGYIHVATNEAVTKFAVAADLVMTPLLNPAGGKVCFDSVDCFSWGSYSGGSSTPSPSGTPFNAGGGLTADTAVTRDISGGSSASMLDAADDTNDSAADFDFAAVPNPVNNGPPVGGGGGGGGGGAGGGGGGGGYGSGGGAMPGSLLLVLLVLACARRLGAGPLEGAERG